MPLNNALVFLLTIFFVTPTADLILMKIVLSLLWAD